MKHNHHFYGIYHTDNSQGEGYFLSVTSNITTVTLQGQGEKQKEFHVTQAGTSWWPPCPVVGVNGQIQQLKKCVVTMTNRVTP